MVALARALVNEINGVAVVREKVLGTLGVWQKRIQARNELAGLTFREIQDIGLDQAEIDREVAKPFWQA